MWQPWQMARYSVAPSLCTNWPGAVKEPGGENGGGSSAANPGTARSSDGARPRPAVARTMRCGNVYILRSSRVGDRAPVQAADRIKRRQHGAFLPRRQARRMLAGQRDAAVDLAQVVVVL